MHVGYVLKKFPRISETFILNEILELERQGVDVTVFSLHRPDDGRFHAGLARLRRPVVYLPQRKSAGLLDALQSQLPALRNASGEVRDRFFGLLESNRADVWPVVTWAFDVAAEAARHGVDRLHAHFATVATHVARLAGAIAGLPYSFTCHAKDIYRTSVQPAAFQSLSGSADFVVTVCDANREHVEERLLNGTQCDIVRLYNGVDLDVFRPEARPEPAEPLVLGVGRLVEKKGFGYLVDAVASLRRRGFALRCCIVGDGDQRAVLEARIAATGLDCIELLGSGTHDEVRSLLQRATLLALPCVIGEDGNRDALPTVLLEALACGVPVVATPIAGVSEIVDGGNAGVLVPCDDVEGLADGIGGVLTDRARGALLAHAGRARAEALFDLRKNVATLRGLFERSRVAAGHR